MDDMDGLPPDPTDLAVPAALELTAAQVADARRLTLGLLEARYRGDDTGLVALVAGIDGAGAVEVACSALGLLAGHLEDTGTDLLAWVAEQRARLDM